MSSGKKESCLDLIGVMRILEEKGLNINNQGNSSLRVGGGMKITGSNIAPKDMTPTSLAFVEEDGVWRGGPKPSSERLFHANIYKVRPDVGAIVHCHSPKALRIACLQEMIPGNMTYESVALGGAVHCTPKFDQPGSDELAEAVVKALGPRNACLIANHGQVAVGKTLEEALSNSKLVEFVARLYWGFRSIGIQYVPIAQRELDIFAKNLKNYKEK